MPSETIISGGSRVEPLPVQSAIPVPTTAPLRKLIEDEIDQKQKRTPGAGAAVFLVKVYDAAGVDPPTPTHWTYTVKNLAGDTLATAMQPLLVHGHEWNDAWVDIHTHGAADGTYGLGAYDATGAFLLLEAFDEHIIIGLA